MNPGSFKHKVSEDFFSLLVLNLEKILELCLLVMTAYNHSAPGIERCVQSMSFSPVTLMAKPHSRPNQRMTEKDREVWSLGFHSAV